MRLSLGTKKKPKDEEIVEVELDDDDDYEEEEEEEKKPRSLVPLSPGKNKMPMLKVMGADLDDDEVAEEMEAAIQRGSSFGYKIGHIRAHLKNQDYQSASLTTKEALLATLIELVPLAESSLRKSGASKGIYQFNSLIGQVRELLVDLDGERDLNQLVMSIMEGGVRPAFLVLTQMIIQFNNGLKRQLRAELSAEDFKTANALLDEQVRELSTYVQSMYGEILRRVEKSLES